MGALIHYDALGDCGITDSNLKMLFPYPVVGRWATMRKNVQLDPNNLDAYTAEMQAIEAAPLDTPIQMVLQSDLEALRENQFIIEKFEWYAFDKNNEMVPNWQPNHFVPSLIVNHQELIGGSGKKDGSAKINQAGIGLVLPYCLSFEAPFNPLQSISVNGQLLRKDSGGNWRNVPVVALGTFRYRA